MRTAPRPRTSDVSVRALGALLTAACLAACGGGSKPKQADDVAQTTPPDDTPKWEGAGPPPSPDEGKPAGIAPKGPAQRREDQYDKEATEVVLKRAARQVKEHCGQVKDSEGKATGPWGTFSVQVVLGANGHGKGITIPPPYDDKPVGRCVTQAFANLQFPPWSGSDVTIPWEVELVKP